MGDLAELLVEGPAKATTLGGVPLWFDEPSLMLGHWAAELGALLARFDRDIGAVAPASAVLLDSTRARIDRVRSALVHNRKAIEQLFAEARLRPSAPVPGKGGEGASLLSAWFQMLRDWGWHEHSQENAVSLEQTLAALGERADVGKLLVLGAGAGRLAYDLHVATGATCSVLLDNNPLPSLVGRRVVAGSTLELFEIPRNPRTPELAAIPRQLRRPGPAVTDFHFVLADARLPVARAGGFDTVLTPWYIDRVDQPLEAVVDTVYRALAPGGRWLNHGPLIYDGRALSAQLTLSELCELVEQRGFRREYSASESVPYLRTEASSSGRSETVHTLLWRRDERPVPRDPVLPEGLGDPAAPLVRWAGLDAYQAPNPAVTTILALVDGRRNAQQIADTLAPRLRLPPEKALALVVMTLKQVWRSSS